MQYDENRTADSLPSTASRRSPTIAAPIPLAYCPARTTSPDQADRGPTDVQRLTATDIVVRFKALPGTAC
jgi:hypothetical protein